ncbi:uncharacterized protein LOC127845156 isoform X2 [Dreissena polymorpha]|uniref:Fibrinogen C-terminal domain-containing protein n=1 Tax=Dreissena polymorpha TaxID=45954 RepID=A0A9D4E420_DREPO|nr:uncharacterized protein LOC127845156 isoform X2 [Dreissena polymorpha]KAH3772075.1 hypothetical protein DPMN_173409 [Dreissena polymorpha]
MRWLIAVSWLFYAQKVEALTCLTCDNVEQPRHCTTVMTCPDNDVCFVERKINSFGEEGYALGCMRDNVCRNITSTSSTSQCSQCCNKDLCNHEGCGKPGYPDSRGPVCYNCIEAVSDGRCHHIDLCRRGEVCSVSGKGMFGTTVFASKCLLQEICGTRQIPNLDIIGKRGYKTSSNSRSFDVHDCFQCCSGDLCNKNCHNSVDGQWGDWNPWSACTNCNQTRNRQCNNPPPEYGGKTCVGNSQQTQECGMCPVDGQWGEWIPSSACTKCNQTMSRQCNSPAPERGGKGCIGNPSQTQECGVCLAKDCSDLQRIDSTLHSGVYTITTPLSHTKVQVFCDMETDGGGWTIFQRRFNGSVDFYRNFSDYENEFGHAAGEYWLGLKYIYEITSHRSLQLRVNISRYDGRTGYDVYGNFSLRQGTNYTLNLGERLMSQGVDTRYTFLINGAVGRDFSTYDHDVDLYPEANCAAIVKGGWWYSACFYYMNLNGLYSPETDDQTTMSYDSNVGLESSTIMFKDMVKK